jgi:hypothetical protein
LGDLRTRETEVTPYEFVKSFLPWAWTLECDRDEFRHETLALELTAVLINAKHVGLTKAVNKTMKCGSVKPANLSWRSIIL